MFTNTPRSQNSWNKGHANNTGFTAYRVVRFLSPRSSCTTTHLMLFSERTKRKISRCSVLSRSPSIYNKRNK